MSKEDIMHKGQRSWEQSSAICRNWKTKTKLLLQHYEQEESCQDESGETDKTQVIQASWATLKSHNFILILRRIIRSF